MNRSAAILFAGALLSGVFATTQSTGAYATTPTPAPSITPAVSLIGWSYAVARDGRWQRDIADPSQHAVVNGDVLGWVFGEIGTDASPLPNAPADFAKLCPSSKQDATPGARVRIAVVVDSTLAPEPADEPVAVSCITVSRGTSANEALSQTGTAVRFDGVVLCAIGDIPADGCLDNPVGTALNSPGVTRPRPSASISGNLTPAITATPTTQPSASENAEDSNAFTQTPRAWLMSGGLLLLAIGLFAASKKGRTDRR